MTISMQMLKQKYTNIRSKFRTTRALAVIGLLTIPLVFSGYGFAQTLQQQISTLNTQNNTLQTQRRSLMDEADSLETVINGLQAQIDELQAQIAANEAKMQDLQRQIAEAEAEIIRQRALLGENIRAMYLDGDISTLEMLASSKDLSEYLDKEQYRSEVQAKVKATLDRINELRKQLEAQKIEVEKILVDQKTIQGQLDAQRVEQARLLALNEAQQNELRSQISANSTKIAELRRQQAAENARLFGRGTINVPDTTGYPWANVAFPNTSADPWGMYKRQCVSYTAWKVWKSGRHMPYWGGFGNANQWDDNARRAGIPVDGNPQVGDVAVSNSGYYGHVMYVEAVYDDGTIYISQYNASWTGTYSEARIPIGNLVFIHF